MHMQYIDRTWAVVLAGGEGRRLQTLTTAPDGLVVPKQYCSLRGGPSLLQKALARALNIAPVHRVCTVVAQQHRVWREAQLQRLLHDNIIEQPHNRGTAHGVLLPLLRILARDADARIVLLPADHYVRDEAVLAHALRRAAACAARNRDGIYLLGIEPHELDPELGYIVPEYCGSQQPAPVTQFVEKPSLERVHALVRRGALWNAFIVAAPARALLALYGRRFVSTMTAMRLAMERRYRSPDSGAEMTDLYQQLPSLDFSRDVLEGQEERLSVLPVPSCGWTDLGTPQRVAQTLMGLPRSPDPADRLSEAALGLDLAAQHWRSRISGHSSPLARSI